MKFEDRKVIPFIAIEGPDDSITEQPSVDMIEELIALRRGPDSMYGFGHCVGEVLRYVDHPIFGDLVCRVTKVDGDVIAAAEYVSE